MFGPCTAEGWRRQRQSCLLMAAETPEDLAEDLPGRQLPRRRTPRSLNCRAYLQRSRWQLGSTMHFEDGRSKITYFAKTKRMERLCPNLAHGRCRLTRTCKPAAGHQMLTNPFQGRVLGFMEAWRETHDQATANDHLRYIPPLKVRKCARKRLYERIPAIDSMRAKAGF